MKIGSAMSIMIKKLTPANLSSNKIDRNWIRNSNKSFGGFESECLFAQNIMNTEQFQRVLNHAKQKTRAH